MMYVALTYDHRIVDGREAVTFLKRIKDTIEDPVADSAGSVRGRFQRKDAKTQGREAVAHRKRHQEPIVLKSTLWRDHRERGYGTT